MSDLEREKFEAWARPQLSERDREIVLRWDGEEYQQSWAQMRWLGWLARSESAPSPTRESLEAEWMAQEKYLDWSNFLLHKLTGEPAPLDLRRAWKDGQDAAAKIIKPPCGDKSCLIPDHARAWKLFFEILSLEYPGESTPTTPKVMPKMLDRARQWLEKHVATVESDQVAHFMAGFANDVAGEAGSPAPAPTEEKNGQ